MAFEAIAYSGEAYGTPEGVFAPRPFIGEAYGTPEGVFAPRPFIGALLVCVLQWAIAALGVSTLFALLGV
jgi:hypothetical protein